MSSLKENSKWAIIVALPHEAKAILPQLNVSSQTRYGAGVLYQGKWQNQSLLLLQTGMGHKNAGRSIEFLLQHHPITHCLITGYCGGLSPDLQSGDALIAHTVTSLEKPDSPIFKKDEESHKVLSLLKEKDFPIHSGPLIQSAKPVRTIAQKKELYESRGAIAVDMESYQLLSGLSDFCQRAKTKIASFVLRFVVDSYEHELADTKTFVNDRGRVRPFQLAGEMLRSPRLIKDLTALEQLAGKARRHLTKSFPWILETL